MKFEWSHSHCGHEIQVAYSRVQNFRPVSRYISEIVQGINVVTIELSEDLIASNDVESPLPAHRLLFAFPVSTSNLVYSLAIANVSLGITNRFEKDVVMVT